MTDPASSGTHGGAMANPINAATMPRRDPLVQGAIEALQDADDRIRNGDDATAELIAAQAAVETLVEKYLVRRKR